jgi:hypothetical protein
MFRPVVPTLALCVAAFFFLSPANAGNLLIDFEELGLPKNSYDNGSSGSGGFTSGGAFFNNTFDTTYSVWNGWAASTMTDGVSPGYLNQYSAFPGSGAGGSATYAVAFSFFPNLFDGNYFDATINLPQNAELVSIDVANTTYTALSIRDGDPFAKKFGGKSGNDPDYLRLTITGFDQAFGADGLNPGAIVGAVDFYLADFRFTDNTWDFILSRWATVDLNPLKNARSLGFALTTSDLGPFGPNTPTYFALDNLRLRTLSTVPEPASAWLLMLGVAALLTINTTVKQRRNRVSSDSN